MAGAEDPLVLLVEVPVRFSIATAAVYRVSQIRIPRVFAADVEGRDHCPDADRPVGSGGAVLQRLGWFGPRSDYPTGPGSPSWKALEDGDGSTRSARTKQGPLGVGAALFRETVDE